MIPVTAVITALNEAENLPRCLDSLKDFHEIIVVDSNSDDETASITEDKGARVISYEWNARYPKKRQWCLDNIEFQNQYIFFIDGDEEATPQFVKEIKGLDFRCAGYFVKGQYIWQGRPLKRGLYNNKLALFDPTKFEFPVIDDLSIEGMGEMEGHYQPVLKSTFCAEDIGQIKTPIKHHAYDNKRKWAARHDRYAHWEAEMIRKGAYPRDPIFMREVLKCTFRRLPFRGALAFAHCYFIKAGFLDGKSGFNFALSRYHYYKLVALKLSASNKEWEIKSLECEPLSGAHRSKDDLEKKRRDAA